MISYSSRDFMGLPQALLASFKAHEHIDHCDDDELIVDKLAMTIERFEIMNGVALFASVYVWTPDAYAMESQIPIPPVAAVFTASDGAGDVTANYRISTRGFASGIPRQFLVGDYVTGLEVTLTAGYPATLPPSVKDCILRGAAYLYEYRELFTTTNVEIQQTAINDWIGGHWQPHC